MHFFKYLYIGDTIKNPGKIKRKLRTGAGLLNTYVIIPAQGTNQLEVFHSGYLQQAYYKKRSVLIIGIANGYAEALGIVEQIVKESLKTTGTCDIKKYLFQL